MTTKGITVNNTAQSLRMKYFNISFLGSKIQICIPHNLVALTKV